MGHSVVSSSSSDSRVGWGVRGALRTKGLCVPPIMIPLPLGACVQLRNMPKLFADVITAQLEPPPKPLPPPKVSPRDVRDERRFVTEAGLHGSTRIACGWRHCVAVNAVGETCAWGSNSHGQVGWLWIYVFSPNTSVSFRKLHKSPGYP